VPATPRRCAAIHFRPSAATTIESASSADRGLASGYIGTALAAGEEIDVAAPWGVFVLSDGKGPVVFLSAGIGIMAVLAMLQAHADEGSTRAVSWLHTTNAPPTRAFASETDRLVRSLSNARSCVFYTADADGQSGPGVMRGRLDRAALAQLSLPIGAKV
jgi:ferredoxin-NADP reductase